MKAGLDTHHEQMQHVYKEFELCCLSDNEYSYKGVNTFGVPESGFKHELWNSYKNLRDLINCNQDLMYFTGNLFLYRPYINNPLKEVQIEFNNVPVAHYHQNWYDHRYCSFASCCFEKAYNFWDRIGDLFYSFYPMLIQNIRVVDFARIIDAVADLGENDEDFVWLLNFKRNEYAILNKFRRDVVHYYQYETTYHDEHVRNCTKLDVIAQLWKQKSQLPEYFKSQLTLSCDGTLHAYAYLERVRRLREQEPDGELRPIVATPKPS